MKDSKGKAQRLLITAVVSSMVAASPAWAALDGQPATTAQASATVRTSFPDVTTDFWGLKHITKLALESIIQGDENGRFNPNDNVSQQDAIIMIVRMLGWETEAQQINPDATAIGLDVSGYAKQYVIEAVMKGLVDIEEEVPIVADKGWGVRSASREWIAKMVIRAVGKRQEAEASADKSTSFKDNADITPSARGYVNAAATYAIVNGFEDGTFKPKANVTRAELATMLSRSDNQISYRPERVVSGYVSEIGANSVKLTLEDGTQAQFAINGTTAFFNNQGKISASDIKAQNFVSVIKNEGTAYYIELLKDAPPTEVVEGVVDQFSIETMKLTLVTDGQPRTVELAANSSVVDALGRGLGLSDLKKGSRVQVTRMMTSAAAKFSQVVVTALAVNKTADGTIITVDAAAKQLTIQEKGGSAVSYPVADGATLSVKGITVGALNQIHAGDEVRYQVTASNVTAIDVVTPYVEPVDQGKLVDLKNDVQAPYISISKGEGRPPVNYLLAPDTEIVIPNVVNALLKDLQLGDELKLDLDKPNGTTAKRITVLSRSIKTGYLRTIAGYNADKRWLTVDEDGVPATYVLTDKTVIEYDGRTYALPNFASLFPQGKKIDFVAAGDKSVQSVKLSSAYEGTITQMNTRTGDLTLNTADGHPVSLKLASSTTYELANLTNATAANLAVGDTITVTLNASQDLVTAVKTKQTMPARLIGVNGQTREITVKDDNGKTFSYTLGDNVTVTIGSRPAVTYSELTVDEPVLISYVGSAVSAVTVPAAVRGKVTAVDPAKGTVTVEGTSGTQTIAAGTAPKVIVGGTASNSLSSVKLNDRVEMVATPDGGYRIVVAKSEDRSVDAYDAYLKIITFKRRQLEDSTIYFFYAKAYIHQGASVYNPNYLLPQDQVRIYLIDGKIVEMEKL